MLRGFATVSYFAADLEAARKWYSELLGIDAYFQMPGYVEFRVGDYQNELGIIDASYAPPVPDGPAGPAGPAGEIIQWHVDDLPGAFEKLLSMGATEYQPPTDRSEGFVTASVVDPFGNILGIMHNPHYLEVLKKVSGK